MGTVGQKNARFDAARRGESWAEKEIHLLIEGYARHVCSRSGSRLAADLAWEDVAQDASARFFTVGLSQYGGQGSEESYLYTLVKTTLLQRVRSADRRKKREELSAPLERVALPTSFERLEVDSILGNLDEGCRDLLRLSFLDDVPYSKLAADMGLAESSVRAKVSRCLRRARELAA